jgi:putative ABC transport system ATP-binding protein
MSEPVLKASHLYRFYHAGDEEVFALRGVSLDVASGEFVAVTGPSGSGKSTLLNCIAGLDDPDGGSVAIAGERISRTPERLRARLRAGRMGIMMQSGNLFAHLSVLDNVRLQQRLSGRERLPAPDALLGEVGLGHRRNALPEALSGGEAARAGLAVALSVRPSLLVCDEPTGEVDEANETTVISLLKRAQADGAAILVATHSLSLAGKADRILQLDDGAVA